MLLIVAAGGRTRRGRWRGGGLHLPSLLLGCQVGPVLLCGQPVVVVVADIVVGRGGGLEGLLLLKVVHLELCGRGHGGWTHGRQERPAARRHICVVGRVAGAGWGSSGGQGQTLRLCNVDAAQRLTFGGILIGHALFNFLPSKVIDL